MTDKQKRWQQRFENFERAYLRFATTVERDTDRVSDLEKTAIIKYFELAFELAHNVIRDYLEDDGDVPKSNKNVIRQAFKRGYIRDGEMWMEALKARNKAVHIYKEEIMQEVFHFVCEEFFPVLRDMHSYFKKEYEQ